MAINWDQWNQIKGVHSYGGLYDNGSSVAPGEDDFLNANNLRRFNDPNTPVSSEKAAVLQRNGYAPTSTGDAQYQHGPGQAIQSPDGSWFWQTTDAPQMPKDYGIAEQQNGQGITGAITKVMGNPLTYAGIAAGAGLTDLWGSFGDVAGGLDPSWGVNPRFDALTSDLPQWAGGAADGLGSGAAGTGLGAASAPEIGSSIAAATGADAAGTLPSWAGGAGAAATGAAAGSGAAGSSIPWGDIVKAAPQLLSGAASIAAGAYGANAAGNAANAQIAGSNNAIAEQRRQFDVTQANNAPFLQTGVQGNSRLRYLMGLGPNDSTQGGNQPLGSDQFGSLVKPFSASDLNADPVYKSGLQFGLDTGTKGINARAIGSGTYDSGATLKALTQFGNDYGSTKANDSFNRYQTQNSNTYNKLAGVSGAGQTAVGQVAQAGQNATNAISNNLTDQGNARAASIVGGANAWGGAATGVGSAANQYQQNQTLQALLRNSGYGGY